MKKIVLILSFLALSQTCHANDNPVNLISNLKPHEVEQLAQQSQKYKTIILTLFMTTVAACVKTQLHSEDQAAQKLCTTKERLIKQLALWLPPDEILDLVKNSYPIQKCTSHCELDEKSCILHCKQIQQFLAEVVAIQKSMIKEAIRIQKTTTPSPRST